MTAASYMHTAITMSDTQYYSTSDLGEWH